MRSQRTILSELEKDDQHPLSIVRVNVLLDRRIAALNLIGHFAVAAFRCHLNLEYTSAFRE